MRFSCKIHRHNSILLTLLATTFSSFGQTTEALKRENQKLQLQINQLKIDTSALLAEVRFCKELDRSRGLEIKGVSSDLDIQIVSCTGDRNTQTVKIIFVVSHKLAHQEVCVASDKKNIKVYDRIGNEVSVKGADLGVNAEGLFTPARCNKIPTVVPVKGFIMLSNVLPSTAVLGFVSVGFKYRNFESKSDYTYGTLEIKNLSIHW